MRRRALLCLIVLSLSSTTAQSGPRVSAYASFGVAGQDLDVPTERMLAIQRELQNNANVAKFEAVDRTFNFEGGATLELFGQFGIGCEVFYQPSETTTRWPMPGDYPPDEKIRSLKEIADLRLRGFVASVKFAPPPFSWLIFGANAGAATLHVTAESEMVTSDDTYIDRGKFDDIAPVYGAFLGLRFRMDELEFAYFRLGYRAMDFGTQEFDSDTYSGELRNYTSFRLPMDYDFSGMFFHVGIGHEFGSVD